MLEEKRHTLVSTACFTCIIASVLLFNITVAVIPEYLLHDDPANYRIALLNHFHYWMIRYNLISPFTEWAAWELMTVSAHAVRIAYVVIFLVPISCCYFIFLRRIFSLNIPFSLLASILPNVLPLQTQIPAGINMSYICYSFLVAFVALMCTAAYLRNSGQKGGYYFFAAFFLYGVATQLTEQVLFLIPTFFVLILITQASSKRKGKILAVFTLIAGLRWLQMSLFKRKNTQLISAEDIVDRILLFCKWNSAFPGFTAAQSAVYLATLLLIGMLYCLWRPQDFFDGKPCVVGATARLRLMGIYLFFSVLFLGTIGPVILLSEEFESSRRYTYMATFGFQALQLFAIGGWIAGKTPRKRTLAVLLSVTIIAIFGINRYRHVGGVYRYHNQSVATVKNALAQKIIPPHSQIVIAGLDLPFAGWYRSTGHFMYWLNRRDVSGVFAKENVSAWYNYDDPFNTSEKLWTEPYYMTGLTLEQPLFLFRFHRDEGVLRPLQYALQWLGEDKNASWNLFQVDDKSGAHMLFAHGEGIEKYNALLSEKGINHAEVLWGGRPDAAQSQRLGL